MASPEFPPRVSRIADEPKYFQEIYFMESKLKIIRNSLLLTTVLLMTACGGGGGNSSESYAGDTTGENTGSGNSDTGHSDTDTTDTDADDNGSDDTTTDNTDPDNNEADDAGDPALTGYLNDAISGVFYETATSTGTTGADGNFSYLPGENITFRLGDTVLGNIAGKEQITLFDLMQTEPVIGYDAATEIANTFDGPAPEFHKIINAAVLLQTLDYDANPVNGIEITDDIASLFNGVSINLAQNSFQFRTDIGFRTILNQANNGGLLASHRKVTLMWQALDNLYASLEIDAGIFAPTLREEDNDADGITDSSWFSTLNTAGLYERIEQDTDGDGQPNRVTTVAYDNGHLVGVWVDSDNDGVMNDIQVYIHDQDGNLISDQRDYDGDGTPDTIQEWEYDEYGRETLIGIDNEADGITDYVQTSEYDDSLGITRSGQDHEGDGIEDEITILTKDTMGNILVYEFDDNADSVIEERSTYEYDQMGNLIRQESDYGAEGIIDSVRTSEYNNNQWLGSEHDYTNDGVVDFMEANTFDNNGNLVRYQRDYITGVGTDLVRLYEYDTDGRLTLEKYDISADEVYEKITAYAYDSSGNISEITVDSNDDGVIDETTWYTHDEHGNVTREEEDNDGDGIVDKITILTYQQVSWAWVFNQY